MVKIVTKGIIILHIALGMSYAALWVRMALEGQFWRGDFTAYYTGWSIIRDGHGAHLYDLDMQTRYQQHILDVSTRGLAWREDAPAPTFEDGVLPFVNPPYTALPFVPLTWLPLTTAFFVWSVVQGGLLVWLFSLLQSIGQAWKHTERWLMYSAVVAFPPLLITLMIGSYSLFMLLCVLQFYLSLKREQSNRAGLWLALGSVKPQLMLMPGFLALGARRWRVLGSGVAIIGVCVLIAWPVCGWQCWREFMHLLNSISNAFDYMGIVPTVMYNFKGTLAVLLGNEHGLFINRVSTVALVGASVCTLLLWRGASSSPTHPQFELRMALTLLLGLLFCPHLHPHDGLLFVAPAVLFYAYLRQNDLPRRGYAVFVLSCPLLFLVSEFTVGADVGIRIPVVAMGVLLVWMLRHLFRDRFHTGTLQ